MPCLPARAAGGCGPLHVLAPVGAGGVAVPVFTALLFRIRRPGRTLPLFEQTAAAFAGGDPAERLTIPAALAATAVFGRHQPASRLRHLRAFARWNGLAP